MRVPAVVAALFVSTCSMGLAERPDAGDGGLRALTTLVLTTQVRSTQVDGVAQLTWIFASEDLTNFAGFVDQIDWAMMQPGDAGVYDFTRTDAMLSLVKAHGKVLFLKIMDRSFWSNCQPHAGLLPAGIPTDVNAGGTACFARIALARRYAQDPAFVGFVLEETALDANYLRNNNWAAVGTQLYPQRARMARELFAAPPNVAMISEFNWPLSGDAGWFRDMVDQSMLRGPDGGVRNGPDSFLRRVDYAARGTRSRASAAMSCC